MVELVELDELVPVGKESGEDDTLEEAEDE